ALGATPVNNSEMAKALAQREAAVLAGEQALTLRERDTAQLEAALREEDRGASTRAEHAAVLELQLREANERLVVATVRAQAMTEEAEGATAQMSHIANHDFLTGLPNRFRLIERLTQAMTLARRHVKKVALMYLDLDHFKHINDTLGHSVGDQLLQTAAKRLSDNVRQSDTVCRQGGDEFVVLLAEVEAPSDASQAAQKLIEALSEPYAIDGHRLQITWSIGISIYPDDGADAETVIRNADTAMYHAKRSGRNNYQMFAPAMNVRAATRRSVEVALRHALDHGGLVLHYQPKVDIGSGAITGAEALVRLRRPGHPLMVPRQFVRIAEDCGLILQLGNWVLREACRQVVAWSHMGLDTGQIAVNVSAREFQGKDFLDGVRSILQDTGLEPSRVEFEMTESSLMQDTQPTTEILYALKSLGVHIALDDFGTGYSSLSYLRRFPVDTLKIDQSFVQDIDNEMGEAVLVNAIIAMAKSLKLRVVAEGVETGTQLAYLRSHGCTEGQGHFFSRPVAADEFARLLNAGGNLGNKDGLASP
ncbi:MAG: EAL domain-containing protein, partial [Burkholderiaceae bacterium]